MWLCFDSNNNSKEKVEDMNKNEAKQDVAGSYQLIVAGKTVAVADKYGHIGVAKCNPTDEFDIDEGMKIAFDRMLESCREIHKGDVVKVINNGLSYTTYADWINENIDSNLRTRFAFGQSCANGTIAKVIKVANHMDTGEKIAYIQQIQLGNYPQACYLIRVDGLKKVTK